MSIWQSYKKNILPDDVKKDFWDSTYHNDASPSLMSNNGAIRIWFHDNKSYYDIRNSVSSGFGKDFIPYIIIVIDDKHAKTYTSNNWENVIELIRDWKLNGNSKSNYLIDGEYFNDDLINNLEWLDLENLDLNDAVDKFITQNPNSDKALDRNIDEDELIENLDKE